MEKEAETQPAACLFCNKVLDLFVGLLLVPAPCPALSLSLCCYFSSSATLRIKANFQMPSVFRLVIWTLDCFHSSWPGCLRCARPHPPFFSSSPIPALFRCTCKAPKDTLQWVRLFLSLSLPLSLSLCVCVHVNFHLPDCGGVSICPICAVLSVRPPVCLLKSSITTRSAHNLE